MSRVVSIVACVLLLAACDRGAAQSVIPNANGPTQLVDMEGRPIEIIQPPVPPTREQREQCATIRLPDDLLLMAEVLEILDARTIDFVGHASSRFTDWNSVEASVPNRTSLWPTESSAERLERLRREVQHLEREEAERLELEKRVARQAEIVKRFKAMLARMRAGGAC